MAIDSLNLPSRPALTPSAPGTTTDPAAERAQLAELAAQFESMLMLEMIKQMRSALLDEAADGEGLGRETYASTIDSELSLHLARAGGLGLAPQMLAAWERQQGLGAPPPASSPAPVSAGRLSGVAPSTGAYATTAAAVSGVSARNDAEMAELKLEMPGRVSSDFGWRTHPISGRTSFHRGIDLAARYGADVPAAAGGRVTTAEEQGSYGLTVVVQHPGGYETRYAHLSSLAVKPGETVVQGQSVGRVGSTGRSTGPHLHFEVVHDGQRIDPELFVRNLTSDTKGQ